MKVNNYKVPIYSEFSEYTQKVRKNLFLISILSIFIVLNDISLDSKSTFFGIVLKNLDSFVIFQLLLFAIIYLLSHFIWLSIDKYNENRIKILEYHNERNGIIISTNHMEKLNGIMLRVDDETKSGDEYKKALQHSIHWIAGHLQNGEFGEKLKKFDNAYSFYLKSQNLRWTLIEFLLPILLGIIAIMLLSQKVYLLA